MLTARLGLGVSVLVLLAGTVDGQQARLRARPGPLPAGAWTADGLALGDLDGNGAADLVLGGLQDGDGTRLLLNDGHTVFTDHSDLLPAEGDAAGRALALVDVDEDGDLDLYVGRSAMAGSTPSGAQNGLFLNHWPAPFGDATAGLPAVDDHTRDVAFGDLDGDGHLDLVLANRESFPGQPAPDQLHLGDGLGGFSDATPPDFGLIYTVGASLGDVDDDGDLDLLLTNGWFGNHPLLLNDGRAGFSDSATWPSTVQSAQFELADLDGDGDLDVAQASSIGSRIHFGDGAAAFTTGAPVIPSVTRVRLADVDGDHDVDAWLGQYGQDQLLLNDGLGRLSPAPAGQLPDQTGAGLDLELADLDGDGDPDAYELSDSGGVDRVLLNDGAGQFGVLAGAVPDDLPSSGSPRDVALGDLDGEGSVDALVGTMAGAILLANQGDATFQLAAIQPPLTAQDRVNALALGDLDGDGDLDAMAACDGYNRLLVNDGSGLFSLGQQLHDDTDGLALGDANGDGDLDLFLARLAQADKFKKNDGRGTFQGVSAEKFGFDSASHGALFLDMDTDGDQDLLVFDTGNDVHACLHQQAHAFVESSTALPPLGGATWTGAAADLDGDGDEDLLLNDSQLLFNLHGDLLAARPARVDEPLRLFVHGAPGEVYQLFVGGPIATGGVAVGAQGLGRVWTRVAVGALEGAGDAALSFRAPDDPTLIGTTWTWQAFVGAAPAAVHRETTTLLDL